MDIINIQRIQQDVVRQWRRAEWLFSQSLKPEYSGLIPEKNRGFLHWKQTSSRLVDMYLETVAPSKLNNRITQIAVWID